MKISAKTRYGIATMICLACNRDNINRTSAIAIADKLKVSKIYLEQVMASLKLAGLVSSTKGSQGGYCLTRGSATITVYDIFSALEVSLLEKTGDTVPKAQELIEKSMRSLIFDKLDESVIALLSGITLEELALSAQSDDDSYMYYV